MSPSEGSARSEITTTGPGESGILTVICSNRCFNTWPISYLFELHKNKLETLAKAYIDPKCNSVSETDQCRLLVVWRMPS